MVRHFVNSSKLARSLQGLFRFLFRLGKLGRLLALPILQQGNDLILHFPRRLVLAEILFQLRTVDNHAI